MHRLIHFEHRQQKLASREAFIRRLRRNAMVSAGVVLIALVVGILGYRMFEGMGWVDAFANASMILSGMGPLGQLNTTAGKLFAGCYALTSGLVIVVTTSILLAPVVHRVFHSFHVAEDEAGGGTGGANQKRQGKS